MNFSFFRNFTFGVWTRIISSATDFHTYFFQMNCIENGVVSVLACACIPLSVHDNKCIHIDFQLKTKL